MTDEPKVEAGRAAPAPLGLIAGRIRAWVAYEWSLREFSEVTVDEGRAILGHANKLASIALEAAVGATQEGWQPIATLPDPEMECFFWVVPKTPEESYVNTSGDPIFGTFQPYLHRGKSKTWSLLSKATHWMPLPDPPAEAVRHREEPTR